MSTQKNIWEENFTQVDDKKQKFPFKSDWFSSILNWTRESGWNCTKQEQEISYTVHVQ